MIDRTAAAAEALRKRSESLHGRYLFRFADRPRATRSLDDLDLMLREAAALADEVAALPTSVSDELRAQTLERLSLYRAERDAIVEVQAGGPDAAAAGHLGARANALMGRYGRHFAGHDRRTRDLALLDELIEGLEDIQRHLARLLSRGAAADVRGDLEVVTENLAVYVAEREAIVEARAVGNAEQQASLLASLANRQFELYKLHFAGHSRLTRRVGLLDRICAELEGVRAGMSALPLETEAHRRNLAIVEERLTVYRKESMAVEDTQRAATVFARLEALGRDADALLDEYNEHFAGQDRVTRDPAHLSLLCDRVGELELQLAPLAERYDLAPSRHPLGLVRDAQAMLEREYRAVRQARLH